MAGTLTAAFERLGGEFVTPPAVLAERLGSIGAVLFDWDGVFNDGFKPGDEGSPFSEVDSMGANLLRFALWKRTGVQPVTGIITGEKNSRAAAFGAREHVHEVISLAKNKGRAFDGFCSRHRIEPARVLFFFDDVLDLDVARRCGVRVMIGRNSAPLLRRYARDNGLADYITAHSGGQHGLREACELVIGLLGFYDEVVAQRMQFADPYQAYLAERQEIATESLQG